MPKMRGAGRAAALLALFAAALAGGAHAYDRGAAVANAKKWYNSAEHDCAGGYTSCTPWSYWGSEACGYPSHGGDCANFLSQNLLAGGHPALTKSPCRGGEPRLRCCVPCPQDDRVRIRVCLCIQMCVLLAHGLR